MILLLLGSHCRIVGEIAIDGEVLRSTCVVDGWTEWTATKRTKCREEAQSTKPIITKLVDTNQNAIMDGRGHRLSDFAWLEVGSM